MYIRAFLLLNAHVHSSTVVEQLELQTRLRETGFRSSPALLNLGQTCFSLYIAPVHSAQNEYLAIDSGGYLCANNP